MPEPRIFALAPLTWLSLPPAESIEIASTAGYDAVGLRLLPTTPDGIAYPLMENAAMMRETRARLSATGIKVLEIEIVRINASFELKKMGLLFETAAQLGARTILAAADDLDMSRLVSSYASLCEAAAPYGLTVSIEFMPWTNAPDANAAMRILRAANCSNGAVLVDPLHVERSATTIEDIGAIPAACLTYAQICDARGPTPTDLDALLHTARKERLLPGEGDIDLAAIFDALPQSVPVSVEIPTGSRAHLGADRWAKTCLDASRAFFENSDARRRNSPSTRDLTK